MAPPLMHHWASKTDGAGSRVQREGEGEEEEVPPPGEDPMAGCGKGPEGGNGTHGEEQRALRVLGFLDTFSFQPRWPRKGWGLLGLTRFAGSSSGKEPGDRGTSLAVPQEGHQEPAFLGHFAGRREDPDFQGRLCLPWSFRKPLFDSRARLIFTFPSLPSAVSSGQT